MLLYVSPWPEHSLGEFLWSIAPSLGRPGYVNLLEGLIPGGVPQYSRILQVNEVWTPPMCPTSTFGRRRCGYSVACAHELKYPPSVMRRHYWHANLEIVSIAMDPAPTVVLYEDLRRDL
jgi:hypothetical protein